MDLPFNVRSKTQRRLSPRYRLHPSQSLHREARSPVHECSRLSQADITDSKSVRDARRGQWLLPGPSVGRGLEVNHLSHHVGKVSLHKRSHGMQSHLGLVVPTLRSNHHRLPGLVRQNCGRCAHLGRRPGAARRPHPQDHGKMPRSSDHHLRIQVHHRRRGQVRRISRLQGRHQAGPAQGRSPRGLSCSK